MGADRPNRGGSPPEQWVSLKHLPISTKSLPSFSQLSRAFAEHLMIVARYATITNTIRSFRSKGLKELWEADKGAAIRPYLHNRVQGLLDALHRAVDLTDLNGFGTHPLKATNPLR